MRNRRERVKEAQKILKGKIQMILNGEKSQTNSYLHHSSWKYSKVSFNTIASEGSIVHLQIKHIWIFAPKIYFRTFCNWHEKFMRDTRWLSNTGTNKKWRCEKIMSHLEVRKKPYEITYIYIVSVIWPKIRERSEVLIDDNAQDDLGLTPLHCALWSSRL